jgi:hypothetical protein
MPIDVDGHRVTSETTVARVGGYVLVIATVLPDAGLAIELHSTYVGHPQAKTLSTHLQLGIGVVAESRSAVHGNHAVDPLRAPSTCVFDHAMHLQDLLLSLGRKARIGLDDRTILAVESVDRRDA